MAIDRIHFKVCYLRLLAISPGHFNFREFEIVVFNDIWVVEILNCFYFFLEEGNVLLWCLEVVEFEDFDGGLLVFCEVNLGAESSTQFLDQFYWWFLHLELLHISLILLSCLKGFQQLHIFLTEFCIPTLWHLSVCQPIMFDSCPFSTAYKRLIRKLLGKCCG